MSKNLVIVESPAKAKTIERFLGKDYKVLSSYGHIRDLKKKDFSIDIENGFKPIYVIPTDKKKVVSQLTAAAQKADTIWLASDEDREGEAISWHLYEVLKLNPEHTRRIVFHEITKTAILRSIEEPRDININLVNAQQTRRVLDRIVGFELSPVLWKKIKPALSAGRVQSVTVRLIVDREREINAFQSEASYRVTATFKVPNAEGKTVSLKAELGNRFKTKEEAQAFLESCKDAQYTVTGISKRPLKKSPAPPFTTSTLQQEAARKLNFSVSQTMALAQRLYESGKITYMRTDSVNLSGLAINTSKKAIAESMGEEYVHVRQFRTKSKGAQEAHEAIRPTYMEHATVEGTSQEKRLYELIWKRTIASQMADAQIEKTTVTIGISNHPDQVFTVEGEVVKFDGFLKVYHVSTDDDTDQQAGEGSLPPLRKGQEVQAGEVTATERFTQHPLRYTEASLVHKLEELGIGRPSTYAPTISTIQQRGYVEKGDKAGAEHTYNILTLTKGKITEKSKKEVVGAEKGKLMPTDIGLVVNDFLMEQFPEILDFNFTAHVEEEFDKIAEGKKDWTNTLKKFYKSFHPLVDNALSAKNSHRLGERILGTDPATGRQVSVKIGRFGPVAQIGQATDSEKPRYAQLKKSMSIETVTLDEALDLFKLPCTIGELDGKDMVVGAGKFGPYIHYDGKYTSIPKGRNPLEVTLDEAVELIREKEEAEAKKHLKAFSEEPGLEILNGRFGPYITYKGKNYKIPRSTDPATLTYEACKALISKEDATPAKPASKYRRRTAKASK